MNAKTEQLVEVLTQLEELLRKHGQKHWRKWVSESRARLLQGDVGGARHLLGAYGGMGSFNDIYLHPKDGNDPSFSKLQSLAYDLAQEVLAASR